MKIIATPEQTKAILDALQLIHIKPFQADSSDAKWNAQRNLGGRTHYYDDETLKWHKSRVLSSGMLADGLLFRALTSDAGDMDNTFRVSRVVVHDVFGDCVSRPELTASPRTSKAAWRAHEQESIDLVAHYREAIQRRLSDAQENVSACEKALAILQS